MNKKSLGHLPRLADGAEKALSALGFQIDEQTSRQPEVSTPVMRRTRSQWRTPIILLVCSIVSMTWAGLTVWSPAGVLIDAYQQDSLFWLRRMILANWLPGIVFAISLTLILGAHELGHYIVTRIYRIRSTPPLFIPFPISPIGTCGALILMEGNKANRRQIFDIGIAGPLAGMVVAIPIAWLGLSTSMPLQSSSDASVIFGVPLSIQWLNQWFVTNPTIAISGITNTAMNPMLMAAWTGMLLTGINMMPISQLDGGHVIFGLLGRNARYFSWTTYALCVIYVVYKTITSSNPMFVIMLILIAFVGLTHPPSSDDSVSLGTGRVVLGWGSLILPILCLPLNPITIVQMP